MDEKIKILKELRILFYNYSPDESTTRNRTNKYNTINNLADYINRIQRAFYPNPAYCNTSIELGVETIIEQAAKTIKKLEKEMIEELSISKEYDFLIDKQRDIGYGSMSKEELARIKEIRIIEEPIKKEIEQLEKEVEELKSTTKDLNKKIKELKKKLYG